MPIPTSRTSSLTTSSTRQSTRHSQVGESKYPIRHTTFHTDSLPVSSPRAHSGASPRLPSVPLSASTMDTVPKTCLPTYYRHSVTTLARTHSGSSQNTPTRHIKKARTSMLTGPEGVETSLLLYVPCMREEASQANQFTDLQCLDGRIDRPCMATYHVFQKRDTCSKIIISILESVSIGCLPCLPICCLVRPSSSLDLFEDVAKTDVWGVRATAPRPGPLRVRMNTKP